MGMEEDRMVKINKIFLPVFTTLFCENLKRYKCAQQADVRRMWTCAINAKISCLGSKNPILALKMLKIRKKCATGLVFLALSGKNSLKYLTIMEK